MKRAPALASKGRVSIEVVGVATMCVGATCGPAAAIAGVSQGGSATGAATDAQEDPPPGPHIMAGPVCAHAGVPVSAACTVHACSRTCRLRTDEPVLPDRPSAISFHLGPCFSTPARIAWSSATASSGKRCGRDTTH
eukprot:7390278-Prymnesium_polylepis.1